MILIYISSFSFSLFLKEWEIKSNKVQLLTSLFYAFSGVALLFFGNYMFHRFYAFMPLAFAGIQKILNQKSPHLYILTIFLLSLTSLYLLFTLTLYFVIWFFFTYFLKFKKFNLKQFLKLVLKLILFYLLGFSMSSILSIPSILYLIQSSRVGVNYDYSMFWNVKVWVGFVYSHLVAPYTIFSNIPNMFQYGENGHETWYSVYTSLITVPIILNYFIRAIDKNKKYFISMISILLLIILFRPLNSIFHGFSVSTMRITFFYAFFLLISLSYILDNFENSKWYAGYLAYFIIFTGSTFILFKMELLDYDLYKNQIQFIIISLVLGLLFLFLYPKKLTITYITLLLLSLTFVSSYVLTSLSNLFYEYTESINKEDVNYYQEIDDDGFYRMYINPIHLLPTSTMNLNQSLLLKFHSVMTYDSAYEPNLYSFISLNNINWHIIDLNRPEVLKMLGVKYYVVYAEDELPQNETFEYAYDLSFLKVYKLMDHRPLGFTYTSFKDINTVDSTWTQWNDIALIENNFENIQDILPSASVNLENINIYSYGLTASIKLDTKQLLFLSIPYNLGWTVTDNDANIEFIKVNGGFIGIILSPGVHFLVLKFMPYGFKTGLIISIIGVFVYIIFAFLSLRKKSLSHKKS